MLQVTVNKIEVYCLFSMIFDDSRLKVPKIAKPGTLDSC